MDLTGPGITNNGNAAFHKGDGGATLLGGPFSPIQGAPESATVNFKMVLNTDGPNWTLEWFKDGVRQSFQGPNGVVNELVYNTNPAALNQFGISLIGTSFGPNPISETFSGISLTDSQEVAAVPEPSTWAMMMLGFAGLGLLSYRRTRRNGGLNFRIA